jgi:nitric oxide dioxygenase
MFKFADGWGDNEDLYESEDFLKHASSVVRMLDAAVNMLGPDLEPLTEVLEDLGSRHVVYGVLPVHYPIVGQALLATLEAALGDAWTPTVKAGWIGIYQFISLTMIRGATLFLHRQSQQKVQVEEPLVEAEV